MNSSFVKTLLTAGAVCAWLFAAGWGMWRLAAYSSAPGAAGSAAIAWPAESKLSHAAAFTLVLALHPECPCSKATVEELDSIVARSGGQLRVHALFVELPGLPEPAEQSALWARAQRIAGVEVHKDPGGLEARRFGARTSGETRLYGAAGQLLFRGGITLARGHVGDNPGEAAVVGLITHTATAPIPVTTPVFGCALWNETSALAP